jgi:hypothetical protein
MLARVMWVLGVSAVTLGAVQACGSDSGGGSNPNGDASTGAKSGQGGKSAGGNAGAGGAGMSGAGGTGALGCDTAACDMQLAPIQQVFGGLFTLKSCCVSDTKCGIDTSAFGALLGGGAAIPPCIDPSALIGTVGDAAIPTGPNITILDGGIIPVGGDGGLPIQLDKTCPAISSQGTVQGVPVSLNLPGCCRPEGFCGGSTHTLDGAGTTVPLACLSYDETAQAATDTFGDALVIPDDPRIRCNYTAVPPTNPPDASVDAGATAKPDAATPHPDAAPTSHPDAARPDAKPPTTQPDAAGSSNPP